MTVHCEICELASTLVLGPRTSDPTQDIWYILKALRPWVIFVVSVLDLFASGPSSGAGHVGASWDSDARRSCQIVVSFSGLDTDG